MQLKPALDRSNSTVRLRQRETSQRERNKAEKLDKISRAARRLFVRRGYDPTTLREIAAQAGVGLGTLFSYARDKRDLLFLIINDDIEAMNSRAFAEVSEDAPLLERLIAIFRRFFEFFGRQPNLSRIILKELTFYSAGPQARRFQQGRSAVLARLAEVVRAAQEKGEIGSREDAEEIAGTLFSIYAGEVRHWLGSRKPEIEPGLAALRRHFRLLITGLKPG
jgi:AcrR family transcriptional regulator